MDIFRGSEAFFVHKVMGFGQCSGWAPGDGEKYIDSAKLCKEEVVLYVEVSP